MGSRSVMIRIAHGSVTKAKAPAIVISHFQGIPPGGAEYAVDEALGGSVTTFITTRSLEGALGDFFAIPAMLASVSAEVVVVMGLGQPDVFARRAASLEPGQPPLLHHIAHRLVEGLLATNLTNFATVLIGAGGGGFEARPAAKELVVGICRAILTLDAENRINEFTLVEADKVKIDGIAKGVEDAQRELGLDVALAVRRIVLPIEPMPIPSVQPTVHVSARRKDEEFSYTVFAERPIQRMKSQRVNRDTLRSLTEQLVAYGAGAAFVQNTAQAEELRQTAASFYELLVPEDVRRDIRESVERGGLILGMEPSLADIPWELCFDRTAGRFISQWPFSRQLMGEESYRQGRSAVAQEAGIDILILANLSANLPQAEQEGRALKDFFDRLPQQPPIRAVLLRAEDFPDDRAKGPEVIKRLFSGRYEFVHYCGHAFFDKVDPHKSGWLLDDSGKDVIRAYEFAHLPRPPILVFGNACESAGMAQGQPVAAAEFAYSLAGAFIHAGVDLYIGTAWEVADEPAQRCALSFYRDLFEAGKDVGTALSGARSGLIADPGLQDPTWASYILYGSPTFRLGRGKGAMTPKRSPE
ncbi:CHAT domain protein [Candidatus Methylomirabilis lanthanidiphila]|uniref:CHAT domain protein n=1 Tax=Candidatus Methylomirabilis lanthanidiphila TaxID=2211376 RepID=A0A564ZGZ4_9BACT|nr:CHAT domain-containing protein [Candidatus Methylomirabilis lanthanidiphila]VUZ83922.1 CHAT domain protein [Candidatus Methylomirabilis lanthanidiphila]